MGTAQKQKQSLCFQPHQWLGNIGEKCKNCQKVLQCSQSITICSCFLFCHERCFVTTFSKSNTINEKTVFVCERCSSLLRFQKSYHYRLKCSNDVWVVFFEGALTFLALALLSVLYILLNMRTISEQTFVLIFSIASFIIFLFWLYHSIQKQINATKTFAVPTSLSHTLAIDQTPQTSEQVQKSIDLNIQKCISQSLTTIDEEEMGGSIARLRTNQIASMNRLYKK